MNREQLLAAGSQASRVHRIQVEGIGEVTIRALSGREMLALEARMSGVPRDTADGRAQLGAHQLAAYLCDEEGAAILSFEDAQQLLDDWSSKQIIRVVAEGTLLNSVGEQQVEDAGKN